MSVHFVTQLDILSLLSPKKICCVCLTTNGKMFDMMDQDRKDQYVQVTGLNIEPTYPEFICWECAHRLAACHRYRTHARLAHCLLGDLLKADGYISEENIIKINRQQYGLESRLFMNTAIYFSVEDTSNNIKPNEVFANNLDAKLIRKESEKTETEKSQLLTIELSDDESTSNTSRSSHEGLDYDEEDEIYVANVPVEENHLDIIKTEPIDLEQTHSFEINNLSEDSIDKNDIESTSSIKEANKTDKTTEWYAVNSLKGNNSEGPKDKMSKMKTPAINKDKFDESIMTVTEMSLDEELQNFENRKQSDNYRLSPFKCKICFKGHLREEAFKVHLLKHSPENGKFECLVCKFRFRRRTDCRHHVLTSHFYKFSCRVCPYVSTSLTRSTSHHDSHKGITHRCPHCDMTFSKMTSCLTHIRVKHPSDIVCGLCGNSFVSDKGLEQHRRLKHRFEDQPVSRGEHPCDNCDLKFATQKALYTHCYVSHGVSIPKEVRKQLKLIQPRRDPNMTIQCEQCDVTLLGLKQYAAHFKKFHPDKKRAYNPSAPYKNQQCMCEACGRLFSNPKALRVHMESHTEGQKRAGRRRRASPTATEHRLASRPDQRSAFKCDICGSTYSTKCNLKRHIQGHFQQPEHECAACGKRFPYRSLLLAHQRHTHLGLPWPRRTRPRRPRSRRADTEIPFKKSKSGEIINENRDTH